MKFLYRDFRPNFRSGNQRARELGFYMQKYCGCVFSEQDRYQKQIDRTWRGSGPRGRAGSRAEVPPLPKNSEQPRAAYGRAGLYLRSVRTCGYPPGPE